jgi:hypothetical protein
VLLVLFEVHPEGGGPPFLDEETLLVGAPALEKLSAGNWVRVRYDEPGRERVFPTRPVEVIAGPSPSPGGAGVGG